MKAPILFFVLFFCCAVLHAESHRLMMSLDDTFEVSDSEQWSVKVEKRMDLRMADVLIQPKGKKTFSLKLYFRCDTKDLSALDTPEKMKKAVVDFAKPYLSGIVEKEIIPVAIENKGWYGFKVNLTDASVVGKKPIPEGTFLYMQKGAIRLSPDSALAFSLMTNDLGSEETRAIEKYIFSFAKTRTPKS